VTEILGNGDRFDEVPPRRRVEADSHEAAPGDFLADSGDDAGDDARDDVADRPRARWRDLVTAIVEPGSLAVAAALCLVSSVTVGPSYRFDAYPFNQGVSSLNSVFTGATVGVRPLHDFLVGVAASAILALAALLAGVMSLIRDREGQPAWVRPVAAGAALAALLLIALTALGAYRTSQLDLKVPSQTGVAAS
jgi:hypothetical protein